jgi:2-polyprenyl-3-methyl-5-hydroxy-6-metoxy-1,4-benzoquinol methylase
LSGLRRGRIFAGAGHGERPVQGPLEAGGTAGSGERRVPEWNGEDSAGDAGPAIRAEPRPDCTLCGTAGTILFVGLRDRIHDVPGEWTLRRCGTCGLVWLDPLPLPAEAARLYGRYYTHAQDGAAAPAGIGRGLRRRLEDGIAWRRFGYAAPRHAGDRMAARIASMLPPLRQGGEAAVMGLPAGGGRLLDVGCGDGALLERFRSLGWRVEGLEPDGRAAARARERGFTVTEGTLDSASLPDGAYQAITLHHVLEHVPDPVATLATCRRLLAPGGRVAVLTPNAAALGARIFGRHWLHWDPPRHSHVFTAESLRRCCHAAGLKPVRLEATGRAARWAIVASTAIRRRGRLEEVSRPGGTGPLTQAAGAALAVVEAVLPGTRGEELFLMAGR